MFHCRQISEKTQQSKAMQEPMKSESDTYSLNKKLDENSCFSVCSLISHSNLLHQVAVYQVQYHKKDLITQRNRTKVIGRGSQASLHVSTPLIFKKKVK